MIYNKNVYEPILKRKYSTFPAKDSTLDIDFVNNRNRVAGVYGAALDGVTFTRSTTATYFGADGLLKTAAINEPRFEYDPVSLRPLGLLIEESRTNLFLHSNDPSNGAWGKTEVSVSIEGDSWKLTENSALSQHFIDQSIGTVSIGSKYVLSVKAKAGERSSLALTSYGQTYSVFDLYNGTVTSAGDNICSILTEPDGWYRCCCTITKTNTNGHFFILLWTTSNEYQGDGVSGLYVKNMQLEAGAFPTSYIPTTTASVTRGADVASMTGANFNSWYNQAQGTFLAAFRERVGINTVGVTYRHVFMVSGPADATSIINILVDNTDRIASEIYTGGAVHAQLTGQVNTGQTTACIAYNTNDATFTDNGAPPITDTSVTTPTLTQIQFGKAFDSNANGYLNGHIERLIYYPKRLPNNLLQYLSRLTA